FLHGLGHFHPENEVTNAFLEALDIGTTEAWIMERVGIRSRRTTLPLDYIRTTRNRDPRAAQEATVYTHAEAGRRAAARALARAGARAHRGDHPGVEPRGRGSRRGASDRPLPPGRTRRADVRHQEDGAAPRAAAGRPRARRPPLPFRRSPGEPAYARGGVPAV